MAHAVRRFPPPGVPSPPGLRPTWTTWVWIGFAVMVVIATIVGFYHSANPRMF